MQGQGGAVLSDGNASLSKGNDCLAALRQSGDAHSPAMRWQGGAERCNATAKLTPARHRRGNGRPCNAAALLRKATRGKRETKRRGGIAQRCEATQRRCSAKQRNGSASHGLAAAWLGLDGAAERRQSTPALSKGRAWRSNAMQCEGEARLYVATAKHGAVCDGEAGRSQAMRRQCPAMRGRSKATDRTATRQHSTGDGGGLIG